MTEALALCLLMGIASYSLFRLVAVDHFPLIVPAREWVSDRVTERFGDEWADGLHCPFCLGAWLSFAVVGLTDLFASVPLVGLQVVAVRVVVGAISSVLD